MKAHPQNPIPVHIFKIVTPRIWALAKNHGKVPPMPVDEKDGFIHLSSRDQLGETLALHFAGKAGLVVLCIEASDLPQGLKWEPSRGGALFPHLYGPLPLAAVVAHHIVDVTADGTCSLPDFSQ